MSGSIINNLEMADKVATLAINASHTAFTDAVMGPISKVAIWIPLYLAVIALMFWKLGWKSALIVLVALVLNVVLADQIANIFKNGFHRLRPCYDEWMMSHGLHCHPGGGKYGFYSAHASNAFSFAICSLICLSIRAKRRMGITAERSMLSVYGIFIFLWAITVSISRVYLGRHFLGDITVGAVSGLITGTIMALLARFAIRFILRRDYR